MPDEKPKIPSLVSVEALTPEEEYNLLSNEIKGMIGSQIGRNPAVTNFSLNLTPLSDTPIPTNAPLYRRRYQDRLYGALTNLPNTLVLEGHSTGLPGLLPNEGATNQFLKAINRRYDLATDENAQIPDVLGKNFGKLSMREIAEGLGGATNDVKRIVLIACYRAGYNPDEIRKYFPNVEQIIGSLPEYSTSTPMAIALFNKEADPFNVEQPGPLKGEDWMLRNYQRGSTNPIYKTTDWWTNPPPNFPYLPTLIEMLR